MLSDIESEFASMAAQLAESDTQAVAREAAVRVSKEQWIRLNADFDNFRKRTVRAALIVVACRSSLFPAGFQCS